MLEQAADMKTVTDETARYRRRASEWMASTDRTLIGSFGFPAEVLTAYVAWSLYVNENEAYSSTDTQILITAALLKNEIAGYAELWVGLGAEYRFWENEKRRTFSYGAVFHKEHTDYNNPNEEGEYTARFTRLYKNPDMHRYFEAGIWDLDLVRRLMEEGVDASAASSLIGGSF